MDYKIYRPCGNDTALVFTDNFIKDEMVKINNEIMKRHTNVEQVGFLDRKNNKLIMAGGEFCGNATRCAAYELLNGLIGELYITVNENKKVNAGINENFDVYCEIPLIDNRKFITEIEKGIYLVKLDGITNIVLSLEMSNEFLKNKYDTKELLKKYIKKYNLYDNKSVGIMLIEEINNFLKLYPTVWVREIDTYFNETACGSGSLAVCAVYANRLKKSQNIDILQPSNEIIKTSILYNNGVFTNPLISGKVRLLYEGEIY